MLPLLLTVALAALAGAALLSGLPVAAPAAWAHLAFALGVMPLILGAMGHFVPVLTRSGAPAAAMRAVPLLALAAGGLVLAGFTVPGWYEVSVQTAAILGLAAAASQAAWIVRRGRAALGSPHPGVYWYLAACLCLTFALAAALAIPWLPRQAHALRLFHLHLNTLGFVGLTAIGTLQVLLPTAAGQPDPRAAARLRIDLSPAVGGALLIAAGAAWYAPLAVAGALFFLWPLLRMLHAWSVNFRCAILRRHGAAPSLVVAAVGLTVLVALGIAHAIGLVEGRAAIAGFVLAFLLPLVSGAASQLLPVWLRPGPRTPWHDALRMRLGWAGAARALLMVVGGSLVVFGEPWGAAVSGLGVALFALAVVRAFATAR